MSYVCARQTYEQLVHSYLDYWLEGRDTATGDDPSATAATVLLEHVLYILQ